MFSRVKEKKPSVLMKLGRRSRSLPRNLGRTRSKEMIVAPDFYESHPTKSVTISQQGNTPPPPSLSPPLSADGVG